MVIICPECSTKFRVKAERIPDKGAKVRCARCQHIFLAEKPVPEAAAPSLTIEEATSPIVAEPIIAPAAEFSPEKPAEAEAEEPFDTTGPDTFKEDERSFSYDQFRELDATKPEEENFVFGSADEPEEFTAADQEEEEGFSFSGPAEEPVASSVALNQEPQAEAPAEPKLSTEEKIARIFADDEPTGNEVEPKAKPSAKEAKTSEKKSSPTSSIIRILLLLILGLAIIAGALYYINGPEQIEEAIQQIFGQQLEQTEKGQILLTDLEGKFVNNQEDGELFVISGVATNNYREPRASIQVKGIIFDQNGVQLLQKTIFCGNPITDQELQTLPFSKLEEMMRNQFGKAMDNMKVNYKETIPFVIAFNDLPKNLSEFSVTIASSEPAK